MSKKPDKPTAKERREAALLMKLQKDHGYMIARLTPTRERLTNIVRGLSKPKMAIEPAVGVKLVVPAASGLGREMAKIYTRQYKKARRRA